MIYIDILILRVKIVNFSAVSLFEKTTANQLFNSKFQYTKIISYVPFSNCEILWPYVMHFNAKLYITIVNKHNFKRSRNVNNEQRAKKKFRFEMAVF